MRRKQATAKPGKRREAREPLAELIVTMDSRGNRHWAIMSDDELVAFAQEHVEANGIRNRRGLYKADPGLYKALIGRRNSSGKRLIDGIHFNERRKEKRDWASMSDDELVAFAQEHVDGKIIRNRYGLVKVDRGLYQILQRRKDGSGEKLIERVVFEEGRRDWASMSDEEIIAYAKRAISDRCIGSRKGLAEEDWGLYQVLLKRKLIDELGIEKGARDWGAMDDMELVAFARGFISENGIGRRKELFMMDPGLHSILRRRALIDAVFSEIESSIETEEVRDVVKALGEFG